MSDPEIEVFAGKLFEWLADFGVEDASARARRVAKSFVREGWVLSSLPKAAVADQDEEVRTMKLFGEHDPTGGDGYVPGAWDEVRQAFMDGHISEKAYDVLRLQLNPGPSADSGPPPWNPASRGWVG